MRVDAIFRKQKLKLCSSESHYRESAKAKGMIKKSKEKLEDLKKRLSKKDENSISKKNKNAPENLDFLVYLIGSWGRKCWAAIAILILLYFMVLGIGVIQTMIPPIVYSMMLIYILNPFVCKLEEWGVKRIWGCLICYICLLIIIFLFVSFITPVIGAQIKRLARDIPIILSNLQESIIGWLSRAFQTENVERSIAELMAQSELAVREYLMRISSWSTTLLGIIINFIIAPFIAFYILKDLPKLRDSLTNLLPEDAKERTVRIAQDVNFAFKGFYRGQLLMAFSVGIITSLALWAMGVPYWLMLGIIYGIANFVPLFGPILGSIPIITIFILYREPYELVIILIILFAISGLKYLTFTPYLKRTSVRTNPAITLLALIIGTGLGGFMGLLLSVPIVAALKITILRGLESKTKISLAEHASCEEVP